MLRRQGVVQGWYVREPNTTLHCNATRVRCPHTAEDDDEVPPTIVEPGLCAHVESGCSKCTTMPRSAMFQAFDA